MNSADDEDFRVFGVHAVRGPAALGVPADGHRGVCAAGATLTRADLTRVGLAVRPANPDSLG